MDQRKERQPKDLGDYRVEKAHLQWFDEAVARNEPVLMCDVRLHRRARVHYLWKPPAPQPELYRNVHEAITTLGQEGFQGVWLVEDIDSGTPIWLSLAERTIELSA